MQRLMLVVFLVGVAGSASAQINAPEKGSVQPVTKTKTGTPAQPLPTQGLSNNDPLSFYKNTYLLTFKAADPKNGQTVRGLLDLFHHNMGTAFDSTHHFRTIAGHNALTGKICVNSKHGIDKFMEDLVSSKEIILMDHSRPSLEQFIEYTKTRQEQMPKNTHPIK